MKPTRILGGIVGLAASAAFVFWLGWLRPVSADEVCENIAAVTKKETGTELSPDDVKTCIARFSRTPGHGLMPWAERTQCLAQAQSLTEMERCDGTS